MSVVVTAQALTYHQSTQQIYAVINGCKKNNMQTRLYLNFTLNFCTRKHAIIFIATGASGYKIHMGAAST